jgi:nitrite reductase (NO-forming)
MMAKIPAATFAVAVVASVALTGLWGLVAFDSGVASKQQYQQQQNQNGIGASVQVDAAAEAVQPTGRQVEYTLVARETTLEIAPGVRVEAWTYNGTIPGPVLRATEGDRVILHFINETPMPHTVHLHGDHDEKDDGVFQLVGQGQSYTYDFIAGPAGALMYHCHVMPVTQHVRMGLYGAMIIDPKEGLPPAREYVVVAGEYDTKDQLASNPEYVFFNGFADQYWDNPLPAKTGELVRIYYVNMGASPAYGFHIHGTIFDAYPSGIWKNEPLQVQTWEVAAGNGAIFEARWPHAGRYLFHIHGMPEEKGTMAYFNVTDPSGEAAAAVDGVDVARTKSISMIGWQENLTRSLQKQDAGMKANQAGDASQSSSGAAGHSHHAAADAGPATSMGVGTATTAAATTARTAISIPKGAATDTGRTFEPAEISVSAGATVTWTNNDTTLHTVDSRQEGLFSSGMLSHGRTFEHTFSGPGTYEYYCALHPWMAGKVSVG